MKELYNALYEAGERWREDNKQIEYYQRDSGSYKKGDVKGEKIPVPRPLDVAKILKGYCPFTFIGRGKVTDKSPLYSYNLDEGLYMASNDIFNKMCIQFDSRLTRGLRQETYTILRTMTRMRAPFESPDLIPVKNGIFDLIQGKLKPFSPTYMITSKINTDYNPGAQKPILNGWFDFDKWLQDLAVGDADIVTLLWQIMREAINPNYTRGKMAILYGEGNNGKGTFQTLLINLIGSENISNLKPDKFNGEHNLEALEGKVCNIGDDISNKYLDDVSDLMSIVTGDPVQVNPKGTKTYEATFRMLCIFSGNELPRSRNKTTGWYRRLCIIPFNADFNGQAERPEIKNIFLKDKNLLEWVLFKILHMPHFDKFIEPRAVREMLETYKIDNDFIQSFVINLYLPNGYQNAHHVPTALVRKWLEDYTIDEGIKSANLRGCGKKVVDILNKETGGNYVEKTGRVSAEDFRLLNPNGFEYENNKLLGTSKGIHKNE